MKKKLSKYEQQAEDFCTKHGVTVTAYYAGHRKYFTDDACARAVYSVTIERKGRGTYSFDFGQSLVDSYKGVPDGKIIQHKLPQGFPYDKVGAQMPVSALQRVPVRFRSPYGGASQMWWVSQDTKSAPTAYDVLAAITKSDPGTHEDFCGDFGYDTDSRRGYDTYLAVQKEWAWINRLFSDCLEELQEIN